MEEHVGVKAPGRQKITARFPLKRSLEVTSFQSKGLSPPNLSSLTRALNVTSGTASPTCRRKDWTGTSVSNAFSVCEKCSC